MTAQPAQKWAIAVKPFTWKCVDLARAKSEALDNSYSLLQQNI